MDGRRARSALSWTLRRQSEVTGAIVGLRSPKQVDGIIGAADFRLSGAAKLEEIAGFPREIRRESTSSTAL